MPVTLNLVDLPGPATTKEVPGVTGAQILKRDGAYQILQCCIGGHIAANDTQFKVVPNEHGGFVRTVLSAYTDSHELVLRPDDVWLALISQFILYYNHEHPGDVPEPLSVVVRNPPLSRKKMAKSTKRNVLRSRPALRHWILPKFSTSQPNDMVAASTLLMTTSGSSAVVGETSLTHTETKHRGIRQVTLEGLRTDWQLILNKLEMLKGHGIPAIAWFHLLHPVISQLVDLFDSPSVTPAFWKTVIHREGFGGKEPRLTGWITAFCAFSCDGQFLGPKLESPKRPVKNPAELPSSRFWSAYAPSLEDRHVMGIGGVNYPYFGISTLPTSHAAVNITVKLHESTSVPYQIVAGLMGVGFSSSGKSTDPQRLNDVVRPVVAWWIIAPEPQVKQSEVV
ncbi:hypothetical protein FB45DRAFT_44023 [Roridomyces roridus]|uniref:Uncharacterized protein n=1 Tax=Roridomyces roridus TaxID=1738132 RepID=A0AAD7BRP4_9AGAR|nr:hypothetical protein FB45DRAFT_44023 [Roridomyces roridus]